MCEGTDQVRCRVDVRGAAWLDSADDEEIEGISQIASVGQSMVINNQITPGMWVWMCHSFKSDPIGSLPILNIL